MDSERGVGENIRAYERGHPFAVELWKGSPQTMRTNFARLEGRSRTYPHIPNPYVNNVLFSLYVSL